MRTRLHLLYYGVAFLFCWQNVAGQQKDPSAHPFVQSKFVPDLSLVMDASYMHRKYANTDYDRFQIPGFSHLNAQNPAQALDGMNARRGFNLNYAELVLASVVDPYFDLFVVCHLGENEFSIEEAYFSTRRLAWGLQIKGGKFLSSFGRLNAQHSHQWDFGEAPLIYAALFGESLLNEKGVRLTWVAPIDTYFMLGGEISQGENHMSFGQAGFADPSGALVIPESDGANLLVTYAKTSFDIRKMTLLLGLSHARGGTRLNHGIHLGLPSARATSGASCITGLDMTLRYQFDSIRYFSVQSEYVYRHGRGDHYVMTGAAAFDKVEYEQDQGGAYCQLISRLSKRRRIGVRFDWIPQNRVLYGVQEQNYPDQLLRTSAMFEYNPTEFSRLRLQYNYDKSRFAAAAATWAPKVNHEVVLQINLAIGAHGAHAF